MEGCYCSLLTERLRHWSALLLILPALEAPPFAQSIRSEHPPEIPISRAVVFTQDAEEVNPSLNRLLRWLDDVQLHTPGFGDPPATEVGSWSRSQLDTLVGDIKRLSAFLHRARESRIGRVATLELYGRRLRRDDVEKIFEGNKTLIRGAVLHADVAVFVGDDLSRRTRGFNDGGNIVVEDGRRRSGVEYQTVHWQIGRSLLDAITPTPAGNAAALLWYRATSAFLLRERNLGEVPTHLNRARQIFPDNPSLLLDTGYLHEKFSSASIQAAVLDLRETGGNPAVESRRAELERAEKAFRQVLALAPGHAEARIRLGHTLGELGSHDEAAAELRKALDARLNGAQLYYGELFLGREEEALGNGEDAKRHFQNAAELYPRAQSPRLALSELARRSGDRAGALRALRGVTSVRSTALNDAEHTDPWWDYYEVHQDDTEPLMGQMRTLAGTSVP
jgi:tetratricopeptide (TPR) repeat protein